MRRMPPTRCLWTALFLLCLWLTACASTPSGAGASTPSATTVPTTSVPAPPAPYPAYAAGAEGNMYCDKDHPTYTLCQTPQSMRDAYGLTPLFEQGYTGKGQTVVLIESFGNPTLQQDLAVYDQRFHLPPLAVQQISPLTVPVSDPRNDHEAWAAETTLDVEVVHALAPDAQIVVLTSRVDEYLGTEGLPEFRQLLHYAIDTYPGAVISNSWASFESTLTDAAGQQEIGQWDALLKQATTQHGITVLAAAGDWQQIESFASD